MLVIRQSNDEERMHLDMMQTLRDNAKVRGTYLEGDDEEYLHQLYRFSSHTEKKILSSPTLRQIVKDIYDYTDHHAEAYRFDPLAIEFWRSHDPDIAELFEDFTAEYFKRDFRSIDLGFHLMQSLKYLSLQDCTKEKHDAIFPTLKPCLGAGPSIEFSNGIELSPDERVYAGDLFISDSNIRNYMLNPHLYASSYHAYVTDNMTATIYYPSVALGDDSVMSERIPESSYHRGDKKEISKLLFDQKIEDLKKLGFTRMRLIFPDEYMGLGSLGRYGDMYEDSDGVDVVYNISLQDLERTDYFSELKRILSENDSSAIENLLLDQIYKIGYINQVLSGIAPDNEPERRLWEMRLSAAEIYHKNKDLINEVHNPFGRSIHIVRGDRGYGEFISLSFRGKNAYLLRSIKESWLEEEYNRLGWVSPSSYLKRKPVFLEGLLFSGPEIKRRILYTRRSGCSLI